VEWVVGSMRALKITPESLTKKAADSAKGQGRGGGKGGPLLGLLVRLGQVPLMPPNVGGWPEGRAWLTTAATQARTQLATALAGAADLGQVEDAAADERADVIARMLGVEGWSESTEAAITAAGEPSQMVAIALVSPEYCVN
jgi:uncharacterized protein (DUF1800 family)